MREMKDSGIEWIGNIPIQWSTLPIRFLLSEHISGSWGNDEQHNDKAYPTPEYFDLLQ